MSVWVWVHECVGMGVWRVESELSSTHEMWMVKHHTHKHTHTVPGGESVATSIRTAIDHECVGLITGSENRSGSIIRYLSQIPARGRCGGGERGKSGWEKGNQ